MPLCNPAFIFLFQSAWSLIVVGLIYGLGTGCWFLMVPVLLTEFFGVEKLGSCYGLVRLMQAASNLAGPLIAGAIIGT